MPPYPNPPPDCLRAPAPSLLLPTQLPPPSPGGQDAQAPLPAAAAPEWPLFLGGLWSGSEKHRSHSAAGIPEEVKHDLVPALPPTGDVVPVEPLLDAAAGAISTTALGGEANKGKGGVEKKATGGAPGEGEEVGFFEAIRRRLFEGTDTLMAGHPAAPAAPVAQAAPVAAVASAAPVALPGKVAPSAATHVTKGKKSDLFPAKSTAVSAGSRVYHGHQGRLTRHLSDARVQGRSSSIPPKPEAGSPSRPSRTVSHATGAAGRRGVVETSMSNPDAGAGRDRSVDHSVDRSADHPGDRSADPSQVMASAVAVETAAKFGLVRMVFGE